MTIFFIIFWFLLLLLWSCYLIFETAPTWVCIIMILACSYFFVYNVFRLPDYNPQSPPPQLIIEQVGVGSYYDYDLNGEEWSKTHCTCASRYWERYSTVTVTNLANGKSVECFVNDFIENQERIIDLSSFCFSKIAPLSRGLIDVKITN